MLKDENYARQPPPRKIASAVVDDNIEHSVTFQSCRLRHSRTAKECIMNIHCYK
jgi:hypothetical protein